MRRQTCENLIRAHQLHRCSCMRTLVITYLQEIEAIKARVKEMEEEAEKLKEMQGEVEKQMMSTKTGENHGLCPA